MTTPDEETVSDVTDFLMVLGGAKPSREYITEMARHLEQYILERANPITASYARRKFIYWMANTGTIQQQEHARPLLRLPHTAIFTAGSPNEVWEYSTRAEAVARAHPHQHISVFTHEFGGELFLVVMMSDVDPRVKSALSKAVSGAQIDRHALPNHVLIELHQRHKQQHGQE